MGISYKCRVGTEYLNGGMRELGEGGQIIIQTTKITGKKYLSSLSIGSL